MKKNVSKTAIFLAICICLTALIFPDCSYADYSYSDKNMNVYNPSIKSWYWGWDSDWSIPSVKLSNGWHSSYTDLLYAFTANSYRGKVGYCFAPGVIMNDGSTYYAKTEKYLEAAAVQNPHLDKDEMIELTGYVLGYGYNGDLKDSYYTNEKEGKDAFGKIWATQILIWEIIVGQRDSSFNYIDPDSGCHPCTDIIPGSNPIRKDFLRHYSEIEKAVKNSLKLPSFAKENEIEAYAFVMKYDGERYVLELEDTNGVIDDYEIAIDTTNLYVQRSPSKITLYSDVAFEGDILIKCSAAHKNGSFMVWGIYGQDNYQLIKDNPYSYGQSMAFCSSIIEEHNDVFFKVRCKKASISLNKKSAYTCITAGNSNYSLKGAKYGVYTAGSIEKNIVDEDSIAGIMTTDEKGYAVLNENIYEGQKYYVKEIEAPKGYLIDNRVYEIVPTSESENKIELVEIPVNDPIVITIKKEKDASSVFDKSLAGTQFTFSYYDVDPDKSMTADDFFEIAPFRKWVIETKDVEGVCIAALTEEFIVSGDELFITENNNFTLPAGYFTINETKASEGYAVLSAKAYSNGALLADNNKMIVGKVDYNGNISPEGVDYTNIKYINEPVYGSVKLTKVDALYPENHLTGAVFNVYIDKNENGIYDETEDTFYSVLEELEDGLYQLNSIPYGKYLLHEEKAPNRFKKDDSYYAFEIKSSEEIVIENEAGVGFVNNHDYGSFDIYLDEDAFKYNKNEVVFRADAGGLTIKNVIAIAASITAFFGSIAFAFLKKKHINSMFIILISLLLINSFSLNAVFAEDNKGILTKEYIYTSYIRDDKGSFGNIISGGKEYYPESIRYEIVNEEIGKKEVIYFSDITDVDNFSGNLQVKNGLKPELDSVSYEKYLRTYSTAYYDTNIGEEIPESKRVLINVGENVFEIELKLKSTEEIKNTEYVDIDIPARFNGDFYEFKKDNQIFVVTEDSPCFYGYDNYIITSYNLNPDEITIVGGFWAGELKEDEGGLFREAVYKAVQKRTKSFIRSYYEESKENRVCPYIYTAKVNYSNGIEENKTLYTIKASVNYSLVKDPVPEVKGSISSFVYFIGIAALIIPFILVKHRKKRSDKR